MDFCCVYYLFFFFQAEDGIRDYKVTGVQTCALPIYLNLRDQFQRDILSMRTRFNETRTGRIPGCLIESGPASTDQARFTETGTRFNETGQRDNYRFCGEALKLSTLHNAHYRRFTRGAPTAPTGHARCPCPVSSNLRQRA